MTSTQVPLAPAPHETISWTWGYDADYTSAKAYLAQRVFGSLVQLAQPIVTQYHGDLYEDARFVDQIKGQTAWYFNVRECGTHLYQDLDVMRSVARNWPNSYTYLCSLTVDWLNPGKWIFNAKLIDPLAPVVGEA